MSSDSIQVSMLRTSKAIRRPLKPRFGASSSGCRSNPCLRAGFRLARLVSSRVSSLVDPLIDGVGL